jgi:hypothetical protein
MSLQAGQYKLAISEKQSMSKSGQNIPSLSYNADDLNRQTCFPFTNELAA